MLQSAARRLAARPSPLRNVFLANRQFQTSGRWAEKEDPAFSPNKTRPEEQKEEISEELNDQGLAATTKEDSPANPKASQGRNPQEGGSQGSKNEEGFGATDRSGPSGGGSPPKAGGGKSGGGGGT